ncbi:glycosyltransferase [Caulobacter sp. FWC2]|uniref:CgeB family protein n=1 Tax=Caulobacter sp. FWC2 TaxID=69664 RepID=UPI001304064B|nr:glycosyltransferase [Caulobacter sp. FWC2]
MKLVYHGPFWAGSTALQRLEAFGAVPGLTVLGHEAGTAPTDTATLGQRLAWRLGWPIDAARERARLLAFVAQTRPDVVLIDSSKVFGPLDLRALRAAGARLVAYYTPDDALNPRNLKAPLRASLSDWDVFFTTKSFNLPELSALGVRRPVLVGKAFDPVLHRPLSPAQVGPQFERFDLVFAGSFEAERALALQALARSGLSVVVYGGVIGGWPSGGPHPDITLRPAAFGQAYVEALHHGRLALGFLRRQSRDRITQRSLEITAAGRPMLAEKTDEHDAHFKDGRDYAGFTDIDGLIALARRYLADPAARRALGEAGRRRCLDSGYSTRARAEYMVEILDAALSAP